MSRRQVAKPHSVCMRAGGQHKAPACTSTLPIPAGPPTLGALLAAAALISRRRAPSDLHSTARRLGGVARQSGWRRQIQMGKVDPWSKLVGKSEPCTDGPGLVVQRCLALLSAPRHTTSHQTGPKKGLHDAQGGREPAGARQQRLRCTTAAAPVHHPFCAQPWPPGSRAPYVATSTTLHRHPLPPTTIGRQTRCMTEPTHL